MVYMKGGKLQGLKCYGTQGNAVPPPHSYDSLRSPTSNFLIDAVGRLCGCIPRHIEASHVFGSMLASHSNVSQGVMMKTSVIIITGIRGAYTLACTQQSHSQLCSSMQLFNILWKFRQYLIFPRVLTQRPGRGPNTQV